MDAGLKQGGDRPVFVNQKIPAGSDTTRRQKI